jgi:1-acyl-sn-glycerol-3-phosphate acyltransferase
METWHYDPAGDLDQTMIGRLRRFPREPDMLVYGLRSMAAFAIRRWLHLYHRLTITGREHLPHDRSFVMVANHASHLDTMCLLSALPYRKLHRAFPAAAKDYFFVHSPRMALAAVAVNAMPFERGGNPRHSLDSCRHLLEQPGNVLILFPEGTRSVTGEIGEFKPGIGLLVAGTNHPVLPCYLDGTHQAWPKGSWLPRPRKIALHIGPPRYFSGRSHAKDSVRQIGRDLREAVLSLAGRS